MARMPARLRGLCKINGVEINYFAHLGDKCRFKHEFLNACRHATTSSAFLPQVASSSCSTIRNRRGIEFSSKNGNSRETGRPFAEN